MSFLIELTPELKKKVFLGRKRFRALADTLTPGRFVERKEINQRGDLEYTLYDVEQVDSLEDAEVLTSEIRTLPFATRHKILLDLDLPCQLIESTTPGHYHLYIDHVLTRDAYRDLLSALHRAGLIQWGFLEGFDERGYTTLRTPWTEKVEPPHPRPVNDQ